MEKPGDAYIEEMAKSFWLSKGIDATRITETDMYRAGFDRCWNTHVVPLQEKIAGFDSLLDTLNDQAKREFKKLESENKSLREENTRLTTNFIEHENAAESPNDHLSYWQYQQFTRAAITKLKEELVTTEKALQEINNQHQEDYKRLKSALEEIERLKIELSDEIQNNQNLTLYCQELELSNNSLKNSIK